MLYEVLLFVNVFLAVLNSMGLILYSSYWLRSENRNYITILSAAGWILGYLVESPNFDLPLTPHTWIYVVPLLVLLVLTVLNYTTSITQLYVFALLGYSLATNCTQGVSTTVAIVYSWILSFIAGIFMSAAIQKTLARIARPINLARTLSIARLLSSLYVFLLSYIFGGNVLGSITSLMGFESGLRSTLVLTLAIVASIYISTRVGAVLGLIKALFPVKYLTSLIPYTVAIVVTQVANKLGLPVVVSLVVFSSVLGIGVSSRLRILYGRNVIRYLATSYVGPPLLTSFLSYIITKICV
ncbi:MAG: hypothetical protein N3G79_00610 [Sulfolobales archaeon]|nr:hypothetical protein [Sulfolobales archaeon]